MTAKERRRLLFERLLVRGAKITRESPASEIARQAYNSSIIEGCHVDLTDLQQTAEKLVKSRH